MLARRVVVCLDVDSGRVVKGVAFENLRDAGDPAELARAYETAGADEIVLLDVSAAIQDRATLLRDVRRVADDLYIPLTVGGGVRSADDVAAVLRAGADKVSMNSAAVARPALLGECAARFGRQCVVASMDARRVASAGFRVFSHGGRRDTGLDAIPWARECERLGAGEILLTSIDRDGTRDGYDLELTAAVAAAVSIPVVASGGAGAPAHVATVLADTGADAALVAGMLHDGSTTVAAIKRMLHTRGVPVRETINA